MKKNENFRKMLRKVPLSLAFMAVAIIALFPSGAWANYVFVNNATETFSPRNYYYANYQKGEPTRLTGTYSLVTSAPSDWSGDYLFVTYQNYNSTYQGYYSPSSESLNNNKLPATKVTPVSNTLTNPTGVYEISISNAGGGKYFLKLGSNYLIAANTYSSYYELETQASEPTNDLGKWTISMSSDNKVDITNASVTGYKFLFYGSTQNKYFISNDGLSDDVRIMPSLYRVASSHSVSAASGITDGSLAFSTDGTTYTSSLSSISSGTTVYVQATPANDCHELKALSYNDGTDHTISIESTPYTFTMPAADVTVSATFSQIEYNISLSYTSNASLSLNGHTLSSSDNPYQTAVACGNTATLTISDVASGYTFIGWRTGGSIVSNATTYTYTPDADASFEAVFGVKYTVTCATGLANGSISASPNSAAEGQIVTITASPATGYDLESLTYNDGSDHAITLTSATTGTFAMPAHNVTVTATFAITCDKYYYLVTEDQDDWSGEYLIVYTTGNVAFNGGLATLDAASNTIPVTISSGMITRNATTSAACFNIAKDGDYYTIQSASGYYIGVKNGTGALNQSTSVNVNYKHTITRDGSNVWLRSYQGNGSYLEYNKTSGQTRFRYYSVQTSQEPIQLYKKGVMKPVITPASGSYFTGTQTVTITAPDGVSTIYYTTNGSTPTTSSTEYTAAFTIDATTTVKAIAVNDCGESSDVAVSHIADADDNIVMTPAGGTYLAGTEVTIMAPGAFHYTTDGTEPTSSHGTAAINNATVILDTCMTVWAVIDSDATKYAKEDYVVPTGTHTGDNPDGIVMNKSVSGNFNDPNGTGYGTGNITLESYVTGDVEIVEGASEPVDVVFVLDFSKSMRENEMTGATGDGMRMDALESAVTAFLTKLSQTNNTEDPHRVSFVLYGTNPRMYYNNNGSLDYAQYDNPSYVDWFSISTYTDAMCENAFFSYGSTGTLNPQNVWNTIISQSVNLQLTYPGKAMEVVQHILANNTTSTHKKVVVTLADGAPVTEGWESTSNCSTSPNQSGMHAAQANYCLQMMHSILVPTYDIESFTIGIFEGADNNGLPEFSTAPSTDALRNGNINRFMNLLSSNSEATSLCDADGEGGASTWSEQGYYFTANTAEGLTQAFEGIAQAAGGANAELSSQAIVQDVMSSQFAIPEGTTASQITVQTMDYKGTDPAVASSWENLQTLSNPNIQISEDGKTVMVTGFDYASNWVGYDASSSSYHGKKLIITIPIAFDPSLTDDDVFHGSFATNAPGSGIYDADGAPVGHFNFPTTQVDHGKLTWVQMVTTNPGTDHIVIDGKNLTVKSEQGLAWAISVVNGMNLSSSTVPTSRIADATITLEADLDMSQYLWVPIGYNSTYRFTGTFNGNGHTIKGINIPSESAADYISWRFNTGEGSEGSTTGETTTGTVTSYHMGTKLVNEGFFGNTYGAKIYDLFLTGGKLVTDTIKNVMIGGMVGAAYNNTKINFGESVIELIVSEKSEDAEVGGIVGHAVSTDNINGVMVVGDITINGKAKNAGAITGVSGNVNTFYTNHTITVNGTVTNKNKTFQNGYVRISNEGYDITSSNGYTPSQYTAPTAYTYGSYATNNTVSGTPLVDLLNDDVNRASGYKWMRSTSSAINGDYPIIVKEENNGFAIVNESEDGKVVRYGEINTLLGMEKYQSANHTVFMYNNDSIYVAPSGTKLYIDENVALKQKNGISIPAYVSITLDNSAGNGEQDRDWHGFSSSIAAGQIGIEYGDQTPAAFSETLSAGAYSFVNNDNVYLPSGITNGSAIDIYSFYEPQYHWINLKRAGYNHWKQDSTNVQIHYNGGGSNDSNESVFTPGKGYFIALGDDTDNNNNLMQAYGTLNNGQTAITTPVTNTGAHLNGYNLIGNPFQSYLDFDVFASVNRDLWANADTTGYKSYLIYDADRDGFREYLTDGYQSFSQNAAQDAPRYINMHQGFFVVKNGSLDNVSFTNAMRAIDTTGKGSITFRGLRPAYPLVNLFCTDENGKQDISVIELDRPITTGSLKMKGMLNAKGNMYIHWNNKDFSSVFINHTPEYVPVWFEAAENGVFTISWNTANDDFSYVHLIDNITGADIDCLENNSYTFEARTSDMRSRFRLVFKPLGIGEVNNGQGENFAFFNGSELVVNGEGELSIIDLNGRVLGIQQVMGQQSHIALPNVAAGVYMLRLTNANSVKVQKIVVRK